MYVAVRTSLSEPLCLVGVYISLLVVCRVPSCTKDAGMQGWRPFRCQLYYSTLGEFCRSLAVSPCHHVGKRNLKLSWQQCESFADSFWPESKIGRYSPILVLKTSFGANRWPVGALALLLFGSLIQIAFIHVYVLRSFYLIFYSTPQMPVNFSCLSLYFLPHPPHLILFLPLPTS